jgi:hypothetical protein
MDFKHDLQKINKTCLKQLEKKKQKLKERWVGLWYNMDDEMVEFLKVQNNMKEVEASLFKFKEKHNAPQVQVFLLSKFHIQSILKYFLLLTFL